MTDVKRRIAAAERALERVRPRIHRITIVNSLDGLSEDDAGSGGITYYRMPGETVEMFQERASNDAEARGHEVIVFGHGPPRRRLAIPSFDGKETD